jgi:phosphoglycolate phosphatase-like HAD superfamily hydrolase
MKWESIFFDFDGVILDSVGVKTESYAEMYKEYGPEIQSKVIEYHMANGGISRYVKFKYWHEHYLGISIDEQKVLDLSNEFSELVVKKVIDSPFISGALETLKYLKMKKTNTYIVTGTPDDEMNFILKSRGLHSYFTEVHGSPRIKEDILAEILSRRKLDPSVCLFVGDAMTDYEAAQSVNMEFLGIVKDKQSSPFPIGTTISTIVTLDGNAHTSNSSIGS